MGSDVTEVIGVMAHVSLDGECKSLVLLVLLLQLVLLCTGDDFCEFDNTWCVGEFVELGKCGE